MRRVYPLALEAARIVDELDTELAQVDSKRKKRKITKVYSKELKESYLYAIKDLYIEDGILLMQLVHRETHKTVAEIIASYRGKIKSEFYDQVGKIWKQDLDATYDPKKEWITELIIRQITSNEISFDFTLKKTTREEYKKEMKVYRADKRIARKLIRQRKRAASEQSE
jgi:phage-related tail protein